MVNRSSIKVMLLVMLAVAAVECFEIKGLTFKDFNHVDRNSQAYPIYISATKVATSKMQVNRNITLGSKYTIYIARMNVRFNFEVGRLIGEEKVPNYTGQTKFDYEGTVDSNFIEDFPVIELGENENIPKPLETALEDFLNNDVKPKIMAEIRRSIVKFIKGEL